MDIKSYNKLVLNFKLPRIEEIPDLELYMDQVIIYVKKFFAIFPYSDQENFITPSMINNYVKSGIIPSPVGKKYTRRHIAYIIAVFFLKQIFSLEETKAFTMIEIQYSDERTAYTQFCDYLESELKKCTGEQKQEDNAKTDDIALLTLKHAALSIANKLYSQTLIKYEITKK